MKRYKILKI